jgi:adenine-specific DNA-methyltransferase
MDDLTDLESLPIQHLVEMIREKTGAGVNLSFPGKVLARQLGRRVRDRAPCAPSRSMGPVTRTLARRTC